MTYDSIMIWLNDVFKGKVQTKQTNFDKEVIDKEIGPYLLNNTIIADRSNFSDIVLSEGYDVVLFLYTTE